MVGRPHRVIQVEYQFMIGREAPEPERPAELGGGVAQPGARRPQKSGKRRGLGCPGSVPQRRTLTDSIIVSRH